MASPPRAEVGEKPRGGGGAAWLLLLPLLCCGGPVLIAAAASAGALGWGALGAGVAVLIAVAVLFARRQVGRSCDTAAKTTSRHPPTRALGGRDLPL